MYEVFQTDDIEGTSTIARFDTLLEAQQYIVQVSAENLHIDEWDDIINGKFIGGIK